MNPAALLPPDVGINAAIAICAVAFVSGTARGFSGFGSALIFMPLASSIADPRLVAALLLIIDFVAAAPLLPGAWQKADRKATAVMVLGIVGLVLICGYGVGAIPAIVALAMAPSARREIAASGGMLDGEGFIKAGVVCAWIAVGLTLAGIAFLVILIAATTASG